MPAYFTTEGDALSPAPHARSPWSDDMLHGRLLSGLAAAAIEREGIPDGFRLTRLTVDLFRAAPMRPLTTTTRVVRAGRRVHVVDVSIVCGDAEVARASAVLLRMGDQPDSLPWTAPSWDVPGPLDLPARGGDEGGWDLRPISPRGFGGTGRRQMWTRDGWQLVDGEELSPLVRAALAADLPNPIANSGPNGLEFINADLTLFLARLPASEWIGLEVINHVSADGLAIGECTLYDATGTIGWSSVCALANERMRS